jgi:hypothetical protein
VRKEAYKKALAMIADKAYAVPLTRCRCTTPPRRPRFKAYPTSSPLLGDDLEVTCAPRRMAISGGHATGLGHALHLHRGETPRSLTMLAFIAKRSASRFWSRSRSR